MRPYSDIYIYMMIYYGYGPGMVQASKIFAATFAVKPNQESQGTYFVRHLVHLPIIFATKPDGLPYQ